MSDRLNFLNDFTPHYSRIGSELHTAYLREVLVRQLLDWDFFHIIRKLKVYFFITITCFRSHPYTCRGEMALNCCSHVHQLVQRKDNTKLGQQKELYCQNNYYSDLKAFLSLIDYQTHDIDGLKSKTTSPYNTICREDFVIQL